MPVNYLPSMMFVVETDITTVLLIYRLYRYRREFHRLVAARNSTRSRFIRLFILGMLIVLAYTPYSFWLLSHFWRTGLDPYSWDEVHGDYSDTVLRVPVFGQIAPENWVQVATGYVFFFIFGTGKDAYNLYKKMLLAIGLGKIFPSLYVMSESGSGTPSSFVSARSWGSRVSSRAKSVFRSSKIDLTTRSQKSTIRTNSVAHEHFSRLNTIATDDMLLARRSSAHQPRSWSGPSFLRRYFPRSAQRGDILPLHSSHADAVDEQSGPSSLRPSSPVVYAHAWATELPVHEQAAKTAGVHIVHEVHMDANNSNDLGKERTSANDWA